ncbi:MAG: sigma 54-interacting transcriptional regulator [Clostridiales bacterium]|nr:sigma 54-interacting transcriptional regulator [Clostridiales bacterium]
MQVVSTIRERCRACYACIRNCPVKAIKVYDGKAEIIAERCISCGNCVKVCSQDAKEILDGTKNALKLIKRGNAYAILAPSFPAAFDDPCKLPGIMRKLGFKGVYEVSMGADIMTEEYLKYMSKNKPVISSACPAVVNLIEVHFPHLLSYLAPIKSPMECTAEYIKSKNPDALVIFIGPCVAKKDERLRSDLVDEVLTFSELKAILKRNKSLLEVNGDFDEGFSVTGVSREMPLSGGLATLINEKFPVDYMIVEGKEDCIEFLESFHEMKNPPALIDILFCKGCISGPDLKGKNRFLSRQKVLSYMEKTRDKTYEDIEAFNLDLTKRFQKRYKKLAQPSEDDLSRILSYTGKNRREDELNCGACGYPSCRDKAIAVYQGIAEIGMCLPYLLSKEIKSSEAIMAYNTELKAIIENCTDGLLICDTDGKIFHINRAFMEMLGIEVKEGDNIRDIVNKCQLNPPVSSLVIREKRSITVLQECSNSKRFLTTGSPIFDDKGDLIMVLINARDLDRLNRAAEEVEIEKIKDYLYTRATYPDIESGEIVAVSNSMRNVIDVAKRMAKVDSTVLILGESGVGKDLMAEFIHKNSARHKGPFIKVNCGAIPENLLESELFGYETGAFTGASSKGKPGLIEMADNGTLLLDEIGELPLNLQVKLLEVIQEKKIIRLGGVNKKDVNIRLITATNKDLQKMVSEGSFREDLYYRINVVPIIIPPLRERIEDIPPLVELFLDRFNRKYKMGKVITHEAIEVMMGYSWPGNIRELENLIERLIVTTEEKYVSAMGVLKLIKPQETSGIMLNGIMPLKDATEQLEKELFIKCVEKYSSTYEIAEILGVNQSTVVRKLHRYGINVTKH